jgi:hypothetical protein
MPWHDPRLTGASGEPPAREGSGKIDQGREFLPEVRDTAATDAAISMSCQQESRAELPQRFLV